MSSIKNSLALKILLMLLIACIVLAVGVTYGRYHSSIDAVSFNITSVSAKNLKVYGGSLSDEKLDSSWASISSGWSQSVGKAELEFFVVNGSSSAAFAKRDQTYNVKLISGVSSESLNVTLSYVDEDGNEVVLSAFPEKIVKGSALHAAYGDGWLYSFSDINDEEISFLLEGEKLSYRNFKLKVSGGAEACLFNLHVTGDFVAEN